MSAYGETAAVAAGRVFAGMPDVTGTLRAHFAGKTVAVAGAGHSATRTLLALAELADSEPGTQVHWVSARPTDRAPTAAAPPTLFQRGV